MFLSTVIKHPVCNYLHVNETNQTSETPKTYKSPMPEHAPWNEFFSVVKISVVFVLVQLIHDCSS